MWEKVRCRALECRALACRALTCRAVGCVLALVGSGLWVVAMVIFCAVGARNPGMAAAAPAPACAPIYVDWEATGAGDGTSWADAYTALQPALDAAEPGEQIWVAAGIYTPSVERGGSGDRFRSFQLRNEVGLYGGFDPTAGAIAWYDRDWVAHEVTLSCDIGVPGDGSDNCYHVFYHPSGSNLDRSAILDGFILSGGRAGGEGDHGAGGGMFNDSGSPTLANCIFTDNFAANGAGMYNGGGSPVLVDCTFNGNVAGNLPRPGFGGGIFTAGGSLTLTRCAFTGNRAHSYKSYLGDGGGIFSSGSSLMLTDCTFRGNAAAYGHGGGMANIDSSLVLSGCVFEDNSSADLAITYGGGGGMFNSGSTLTVFNCIFHSNQAWGGNGGAISNWDSALTLSNCIFIDNSAQQTVAIPTFGGALYIQGAISSTLINTILWGNTPDAIDGPASVSYSDIQGGYAGVGNLDVDPLFVDPAGGDYHLQSNSPCIDAGAAGTPYLPLSDFEGETRVADGGDSDGIAVPDMGADEVVFVSVRNSSPTPLGNGTTLWAIPSGVITPTGAPAWDYAWAFGDDVSGSGAVVTHTYAAPGQYTAVMTATFVGGLVRDMTSVIVYTPHVSYLPLVFRVP